MNELTKAQEAIALNLIKVGRDTIKSLLENKALKNSKTDDEVYAFFERYVALANTFIDYAEPKKSNLKLVK